jgi:coiled-coil domain-containing protein 6
MVGSAKNRLWKRMEKLEAEKRHLQEKLEQPGSEPMSPRTSVPTQPLQLPNQPMSLSMPGQLNLPHGFAPSSEQASNLTEHIINLRREVSRLKTNLEKSERDHKENISRIIREEKAIKDENVRLQRRLQMEVDRREALCRHLSESESSLEMDDERHFNETSRVRTVSSPIPGYLVPSTGFLLNDLSFFFHVREIHI